MDDHAQALTIEPGTWGPDAEHWLSKAMAHATLIDYRLQIASGAALFYVKYNGATVGAFLLRVDHVGKGSEGVIVAAAASLRGIDLTACVLPIIEAMFKDVVSIRYHTAKPAVARKLQAYGYTAREIICAKDMQ